MRLHRSFQRGLSASFVVLSLLFFQVATAAYACPGAADAAGMAETMAAGEPCAGMDLDQPLLCYQQAADPSQSFEPVKLATPSPAAIVQVLVLPARPDPASALARPSGAPFEARLPPGTVFRTTLRLRV